jgi:hypothetical protein
MAFGTSAAHRGGQRPDERDADLDRREERVRRLLEPEGRGDARGPWTPRLETADPRRHEGDLGGREEPVQHDGQHDERELDAYSHGPPREWMFAAWGRHRTV